ncbi:hypothetical protein TUZN_1111 [Thermoproteus uzoniensis 768-20]|uniref:Uncharacterized protein n=1 Tax=Thermoproteus uzoniensis (strain 768-20) TaxID=999630 RepID=F2L0A9_THEU7|nr:hypothetical protein [Thermoproteus uzoniensis]AEA12591.1 hypothetical protein TUZN_1111 [Thermoproteus uzoniensis 768-20]
MKLGQGAKWGAVTGLIGGAVSALEIYVLREEIYRAVYEAVASAAQSSGAALTQQQIQQIAELSITGAYIGAVVGSVIWFVIIGLIMAAVWDRLRLPWYSKGAIFGVIIVGLNLALGRPPAAALVASGVVVNFLLALLLAYFLSRVERAAAAAGQ